MSSKESENSAALRVLNLRKTYKAAAAPALDGVTFEVGQGEFFGLLGPNGAGKSTLIGTVAGLVKPDAGSAYILGRDTVKARRTQPVSKCNSPVNPGCSILRGQSTLAHSPPSPSQFFTPIANVGANSFKQRSTDRARFRFFDACSCS